MILSTPEHGGADILLYQCYLSQLLDITPSTFPSYPQVHAMDKIWRPHFRELLDADVGDLQPILASWNATSSVQATLTAALHARVSDFLSP